MCKGKTNKDGLLETFICYTIGEMGRIPSVVIPSDLLSSDTALLGCRLPSSAPPPPPPPLKNLEASNDLWPGTYLALERQNLHLPGFFLPDDVVDDDAEVAAAVAAAAAASFCCNVAEGGREIV